jgi:hypothetical protein
MLTPNVGGQLYGISFMILPPLWAILMHNIFNFVTLIKFKNSQ